MRIVLLLAAAVLAAAPASAQTARATSGDDVVAEARPGRSVVRGVRSTQRISCDQEAVVGGTGNRTTITGACRRVLVGGSGNVVTVSLAGGAQVFVGGTGNAVRWTLAEGGAEPQVMRGGTNNSVDRAR